MSLQRRHRRIARRWQTIAFLVVASALALFITTRGKAHSYVLGTAKDGTVSENISISGALQATRSWNMYFTTPGTIATVDVDAGARVHRGQTLATLKTGPLQAQVSSAEAAVTADAAKLSADEARLSADQAKLDGDQAKQSAHPAKTPAQSTADSALISADEHAISADQAAVTSDEDTHTAAEHQLSIAEANLAAATLRSPASATVAQVNVAPGQTIGGGAGGGGGGGQTGSAAGNSNQTSATGSSGGGGGSSAAVTLVNGTLRAIGQVSDSQIAQVRVGERALVTPAGQTTALDGRVNAIIPTAIDSGGAVTYPIQIGWSGHGKRIFNGMSAQISIVVARATGVTVPSSAVHTSGPRNWVLVVRGARLRNGRARGGQATRQTIETGPSGGGLTIVRSGLKAGEQVELADNTTPLPSSSVSIQNGSGKGSPVRKLLG